MELRADEDADVRSIYESHEYRSTFEDFYARLEVLPGDMLVDEMKAQIETALMRGGYIAPADLQPKIRQVEMKVHERLRGELCAVETAGWSQKNLELVGLGSVRSELSDYKVYDSDYARLVSVLVRILEGKKARFCSSEGFHDLAQ